MNAEQAADLAEVFALLANDTRIRLLHALVRTKEVAVSDLADAVGMKTQAVSNQLQRMSAYGIVGSRREGTSILYRLVDPCVATLLDRGWCLKEDSATRSEIAR